MEGTCHGKNAEWGVMLAVRGIFLGSDQTRVSFNRTDVCILRVVYSNWSGLAGSGSPGASLLFYTSAWRRHPASTWSNLAPSFAPSSPHLGWLTGRPASRAVRWRFLPIDTGPAPGTELMDTAGVL